MKKTLAVLIFSTVLYGQGMWPACSKSVVTNCVVSVDGNSYLTSGAYGYPVKFLVSNPPGAIFGNKSGDIATDTVHGHVYSCTASPTTAPPACTAVTSGGWLQIDGGGGGGGGTVASGTTAMPTTLVAANSCDASATTATATGASGAMALPVSYASDPTGVTGYGGGTGGGITIAAYITSNTVNFKRCNQTNSGITPGAISLNWVIQAAIPIANGVIAIPTSSVSGNSCDASATTTTATGALTSDTAAVSYATDPTGITGYGGGTSGGISLRFWVTSNTLNVKRCNETGSSITPGALSVNWRIAR